MLILLPILLFGGIAVDSTADPSFTDPSVGNIVDINLTEGEVWDDAGWPFQRSQLHPLPISYVAPKDLPNSFSWADVNGVNYLTKSLNQHIPQYCGSCWAHASMSSLADRIKIARKAKGADVNLSIQYILNCGLNATGSCHGGSMLRTFAWIHHTVGSVPYDTCQPYIACSADSEEGFCPHVDTSCTAMNVCRTCSPSGMCREVKTFPQAQVSEFGVYKTGDIDAIKAEIFVRGPVVAGIWGKAIAGYRGGIFDDINAPRNETHAVSIVGWGEDSDHARQYWVVRNSWGVYWGEMGYFRILMGKNILGIEENVVWATPGNFSEVDFPCYGEVTQCMKNVTYVDPSTDVAAIQMRLGKSRT